MKLGTYPPNSYQSNAYQKGGFKDDQYTTKGWTLPTKGGKGGSPAPSKAGPPIPTRAIGASGPPTPTFRAKTAPPTPTRGNPQTPTARGSIGSVRISANMDAELSMETMLGSARPKAAGTPRPAPPVAPEDERPMKQQRTSVPVPAPVAKAHGAGTPLARAVRTPMGGQASVPPSPAVPVPRVHLPVPVARAAPVDQAPQMAASTNPFEPSFVSPAAAQAAARPKALPGQGLPFPRTFVSQSLATTTASAGNTSSGSNWWDNKVKAEQQQQQQQSPPPPPPQQQPPREAKLQGQMPELPVVSVQGQMPVVFGMDIQTVPEATYSARDLRRALRELGTVQSLGNRRAIPTFSRSLRDGYLVELGSGPFGARNTFQPFKEFFESAKGPAHRKALVYTIHELFALVANRCRGKDKEVWKKKAEGWQEVCTGAFLSPIGKLIRAMSTDERSGYVKLAKKWAKDGPLSTTNVSRVKDSWDIV